MTDEQENTKEESRSFCDDMPFVEMMRKMMEQEGACCGADCTEMMSQMMEKMKAGGEPMAMCKQMMEKGKRKC